MEAPCLPRATSMSSVQTCRAASQVWPELGLHYALVGKMAWAEDRVEEGGAALQAAHDILSATLPPSNRAIVERVEQYQAISAAHKAGDTERVYGLLMAVAMSSNMP